jgi:ribosome-binding protein aMBF1 (putative translation factor)
MSGSTGHRLDSLKTERASAGLSVTALAKKANVSDWLVRQLETGGNCEGHAAQRIADALGVSLATLGKKDL